MKPLFFSILSVTLLLTGHIALRGQVAINNDNSAPNASAMLDVKSTAKGLLAPRMTTAQRTAISSPAEGLLVYDTSLGAFYYYRSGTWTPVTGTASGWLTTGNSGTNPAVNFIGTTDNKHLAFRVNNTTAGKIESSPFYNTSLGYNSLKSITSGGFNAAFGGGALFANQTGNNNVAVGVDALLGNVTGSYNTAIGPSTLSSNNSGFSNVAIGAGALTLNTNKSNQVAVGDSALYHNGTGSSFFFEATNNTAIGSKALYSNTYGYENTANGWRALYSNTAGVFNTANGARALYSNTAGTSNTANGAYALYLNTLGYSNTANGRDALYSNTNGYSNTANGREALYSNTEGKYNTANGRLALYSNTTGSYNTASGYRALDVNTTGYNNVAMGARALFSNQSGSNLVAVGDSALYSNGYSANIGQGQSLFNTAVGSKALWQNTTGHRNTATGFGVLVTNTSGYQNTAYGTDALQQNITGNSNTAAGFSSQKYSDGWQNTSLGANSMVVNTTGNYNTALGYNTGPAGPDYENTTCVGIDATAYGDNRVRLGNIYVTSIGGFQNWTNVSDGRFKENVQENVPGLAFIQQLRPVTYRLNREKVNDFNGVNERRSRIREEDPNVEFLSGDPLSPLTTGFIAQEVEQAARSLGFEFSGVDKPQNDKDMYGLRYAEFVVPLVKAVQEQQAVIAGQQKTIESLSRELELLKEAFSKMAKSTNPFD